LIRAARKLIPVRISRRLAAVQRALTSFRRARQQHRVPLLVVLLSLVAVLPWLLPSVTGSSAYWNSILVKIGLAVLLASGLNVVVGLAGLLDLGYVAFFAVGAYTFGILTGAAKFSLAQLTQSQNAERLLPHWHMYYWLLLLVAFAAAVAAGVAFGAPTLRLRGDYLAIVTLGFGEIVRITANNLQGLTVGPFGISQIPHPEIHIASLHYNFGLDARPYYLLLFAVILTCVVLLQRMSSSRFGRAWAAIREDEVAAGAMGVATVRMKLLAFATGAGVASLAGVIYASQVSFISPDTFSLFNVSFGSLTVLAMVVIGGMGSLAGPILGAALVIFLPERFRFLGDSRMLVFGFALIVVMILRPQGLIANRRRAEELHEPPGSEGSALYGAGSVGTN
jgi:branched-chain amino acid transport system permease protein